MFLNDIEQPIVMEYKCVNIISADGNYVLDADNDGESIWTSLIDSDTPGAKWLVGKTEDDKYYRFTSNSNRKFLQQLGDTDAAGTNASSTEDIISDWDDSGFKWSLKFVDSAEHMVEAKMGLELQTGTLWLTGGRKATLKIAYSANKTAYLTSNEEEAQPVKIVDLGVTDDVSKNKI